MSASLPVIIIGSGFAGLSAAKALLQRNIAITMVDVGRKPEAATQQLHASYATTPSWKWPDSMRQHLAGLTQATTSGVSAKTWFGSDFASSPTGKMPLQLHQSKFYTSEAQFGLGNIWGCGMLPMLGGDMADWPITLDDLAPHYQEVLEFVPLSGMQDTLAEVLPLYCRPQLLPLTSQGRNIQTHFQVHREKLTKAGLHFGSARLAGNFSNQTHENCQQCGMCMYGCPYGVLHSGESTFTELLAHPNFTYVDDFVVQKVEQDATKVTILGINSQGLPREAVAGSYVMVCAGVPATTHIILNSLQLFNRPVRLKTSEQCYIPLLSLTGSGNIDAEMQATTSQAFWLLQDSSICEQSIHLSIYGYNPLYLAALQRLLKKAYPALALPAKALTKRLLFAFCYLHSDVSAELVAELRNPGNETLHIYGQPAHASRQIMSKVRKKLQKLSFATGLLPIPFYSGMKQPGGGNHFGGAFPMRNTPGEAQCDAMGRLYGMDKVFVADASCFPSITATTITMSVMANAHRIACHVATLNRS